jgi:hypothetical protein
MIRSSYSWKKSVKKGLKVLIPALIAFLGFAGFGDLYVTDLYDHFLRPMLTGITVASAVTMLGNFITYNYLDGSVEEDKHIEYYR